MHTLPAEVVLTFALCAPSPTPSIATIDHPAPSTAMRRSVALLPLLLAGVLSTYSSRPLLALNVNDILPSVLFAINKGEPPLEAELAEADNCCCVQSTPTEATTTTILRFIMSPAGWWHACNALRCHTARMHGEPVSSDWS
jgi:hypothetical protein